MPKLEPLANRQHSPLVISHSELGWTRIETIQASGMLDERFLYRGRRKNLAGASNDFEALEIWIAGAASAHTQRNYRYQTYRFMLWAASFGRGGLAQITIQDIRDFLAWLAKPEKLPAWEAQGWRVIDDEGLSTSSINVAHGVLKSLYTWLNHVKYLKGNPAKAARSGRHYDPTDLDDRARRKAEVSTQTGTRRYLDADLWAWLLGWLERRVAEASAHDPDSIATRSAIRDRFIVKWLYWCGSRRSESAYENMGAIRQIGDIWVWTVLGKGNEVVDLVLEDHALWALREYRIARMLPALPLPDKTEASIPLIADLAGNRGLTDTRVYQLVKKLFAEAATAIEETEPTWAETLRKASPHWLRHSYLTHFRLRGGTLEEAADRARHAKVDTTRQNYLHADLTEVKAKLDRLKAKRS